MIWQRKNKKRNGIWNKVSKEKLQVELDTLARTNQLVGAGEFEKRLNMFI